MDLRPLLITTPDGSGQTGHPDVIDSGSGFCGHRYWLAATPYPFGNDRLENPIIRVSDDGVHWSVPAGVSDPLVEAPADPARHWSDTDLVLHQNMLHLFFRGCARDRTEAQLLLMTSTDGVRWSPPTVIHTGEFVLSPAVVHEPDGWSMWHVWCDGTSARVLRQQAEDPLTWREPQPCTLPIAGHVPWHLDVITVAGGYEALICAFPLGTDPSRCRLFHASSTDGMSTVTAGTKRPRLTVREDLVGFATYVGLRRTPPWLRTALRGLLRGARAGRGR